MGQWDTLILPLIWFKLFFYEFSVDYLLSLSKSSIFWIYYEFEYIDNLYFKGMGFSPLTYSLG